MIDICSFLLIKCLTIKKKRITPIKGIIAKKMTIKRNQRFVLFLNNLFSYKKDHPFETNIPHDIKNM